MPTVLVTGANRGLGLEFCRQYAADGWHVIAIARRRSAELDDVLESAGDGAFHELDVTDHAAIESLAESLDGTPIDVLLLSAGTMGNVDFGKQGLSAGGFGDSDFDDWRRVLEVNTLAPMKFAEAFVEHVAASDRRKIAALSSMVASMSGNTVGGLYAYRASKAALNAVMRSLSIDLKKRGIIAVPMHPGWAQTDMGGPQATVSVTDSAAGIRRVIAGLTPEKSGRFWCYDGSEMDW